MCCEKKPLTKREAQTALNKNRRERGFKWSRGRKEIRMYQCEECNMFHLTKMKEEEFTDCGFQGLLKGFEKFMLPATE